MKKRILSMMLVVAVVLLLPLTVFATEIQSNETIDVFNSDIEAYRNDWYYYVDSENNNCVYKETVDHENKSYLTEYEVNQIAVTDNLLYLSVDNQIKTINLNTKEEKTPIFSEYEIERFAVCEEAIYYLSNKKIIKSTGESCETIIDNNNLNSFWLENKNNLSYMIDNDDIYTLDLENNNVSVKYNTTSDLGEIIPVNHANDSGIMLFSSISSLKNKFPNGKYWNHPNGSNNPDGYSSTRCTHHGSCGYYPNNCLCNSFSNAIQCHGFGIKLTYDYYGSSLRDWSKAYNLNSLKAGDAIRYKNDGHTIWVTAVNGDTITYADCNSDGGCKIRWDATISKSTVASTLTCVYVAPSTASSDNYVDLGTNFFGVILNTACWKPIECGADGIVRLQTETGSSNQVWFFVRQNDGSYVINSASNGKAMEMYSGITTDGTTVQVCGADWGGAYQRWYIYQQGNGYIIKSKHYQELNKVLDLSGGSTVNGNVINTYSQNNSAAQIWSIYKADDVQLKAPTLSVSAGKSATNTKFSWNQVYGETYYILSIKKNGSTYKNIEGIYDTSYSINLPSGSYTATVQAVNYYHGKTSASVSFTVTDSTYTVTLNNQSATTAGTTSVTATYGSAMPSITVPKKTGYTFGGYYTGTSGSGTQYYTASGTSARNWDKTSATTLYAKWTANKYTVTLNNQSATTAGTTSVTATYDSAMPSITVPKKTGYTFGGYYTETSGSGTQYYTASGASARNWDKTSATTLYAKWTPISYTVKYNGNGATSGSTANSIHSYGTAQALTANGFLRTGYTFLGWSTSSSATSATYSNQQSVTNFTSTNGATINLYAVWQKNTYTLYERARGGMWYDGSTANKSSQLAYQETKTILKPTKTGYTFGAWALDFSGTGHIITGSGTTGLAQVRGVPMFADPVFNYSNGSVYVYNNAGNGTVTHKRVPLDNSFGITTSSYMMEITTSGEARPELGGFVQDPCYSKPNGIFYHVIAAKIPVGYTIQRASNSCGDGATHEWLTPQEGTGKWETYIYKTACGAKGTFSTFGHVYLSGPTATASKPVTWYVGYAEMFDATNVSSTGSTYTMGSSDGYLQALWVPNRYTIIYNGNGATSGSMSNSTHIYDTAKTLTANAYVRDGYEFLGWATESSATVAKYIDKQSVINLSSVSGTTVNLYAVWKKLPPHTDSEVTKNGNTYTIQVKATNLPSCDIMVAGYQGNQLVEVVPSVNGTATLSGDIDTIKVMAWDSLEELTSLCEAEVIEESEFIIE